MKQTYTIILKGIISFVIFLASCVGEKGEVGPKGEIGLAGANGTNGTVGAKGETGAQGAAGETGAKGETGGQGMLNIKYTPWISEKNVSGEFNLLFKYDYSTFLGKNVLIPAENDNTESNSRMISNKETMAPIGILYTYIKFTENKEDYFFAGQLYHPSFNLQQFVAAEEPNNLVSFITVKYKKDKYPSGTTKDDFVKILETNNFSVRYVFLPLELKNNRNAHVDMTDYNQVKEAFELKD